MKDKLWFQQLFQISPTPDTFVQQFAAKLFILDILATIKIGQKHFLHITLFHRTTIFFLLPPAESPVISHSSRMENNNMDVYLLSS